MCGYLWVLLLVTIVINEGGGFIDSISIKVLHLNKFTYFPKMKHETSAGGFYFP